MEATKRKSIALWAGLLLVWPAVVLAIGTIKKLDLKDGVNGNNEIEVPIFDAKDMAPLYIGPIERGYDLEAMIVRKGSKGDFWMGSGSEYYLAEKVNLADLLVETLNSQGEAMGFQMTSSDEGAWQVSGTLRDIYLDNEMTFAPTLFYGYTLVELHVRSPEGETTSHELALYNYWVVYKGGFSKKPRAREALAVTVVEAAHEILSYLNATTFQAPVHPKLIADAKDLERANHNEIYRLGLTGSSEMVSPLLNELTRRDDEDERMVLIVALARIRSAEAVSFLGQQYDDNGDDARWATIKAMGYIGGESALNIVRDKGMEDEYLGAKSLANHVLERNAPDES